MARRDEVGAGLDSILSKATAPKTAAGAARPAGDAGADPPVKARQSESTTTAGGLLHRSIYVTADEWRAVKLAALADGVTAAEIVRRALRAALDVRDTT